jgi:hypothetical protein
VLWIPLGVKQFVVARSNKYRGNFIISRRELCTFKWEVSSVLRRHGETLLTSLVFDFVAFCRYFNHFLHLTFPCSIKIRTVKKFLLSVNVQPPAACCVRIPSVLNAPLCLLPFLLHSERYLVYVLLVCRVCVILAVIYRLRSYNYFVIGRTRL